MFGKTENEYGFRFIDRQEKCFFVDNKDISQSS